MASVGAPALAEDAPTIFTERPSFSSSPLTVAPGVLQLETGYRYTRVDGDANERTAPLALLRVGLAPQLELQLNWTGYSWTDQRGRSVNGVREGSVGVKWRMNEAEAAVPLALFASLSVPIRDDAFGDDDVRPTLGAFWSHSGVLDWFGTVLMSESNGDATVGNAVGINLPLAGSLSGYVEFYGSYFGDAGPEHRLNGGVAWVLRPDLQIDANTGFGLNDQAADFFLGFGASYRF